MTESPESQYWGAILVVCSASLAFPRSVPISAVAKICVNPGGSVLVTGGFVLGQSLTSAELYTP